MDPCDFGKILNDACHLTVHCRKSGYQNVCELSENNLKLLLWRTGISHLEDNCKICFHHEKCFLSRYEQLQKHCCDPYKRHKKKVTGGLRTVDVETAERFKFMPRQTVEFSRKINNYSAML